MNSGLLDAANSLAAAPLAEQVAHPSKANRGEAVHCYSLRSNALQRTAAQHKCARGLGGMFGYCALSIFTAPPFKGKAAAGGLGAHDIGFAKSP